MVEYRFIIKLWFVLNEVCFINCEYESEISKS